VSNDTGGGFVGKGYKMVSILNNNSIYESPDSESGSTVRVSTFSRYPSKQLTFQIKAGRFNLNHNLHHGVHFQRPAFPVASFTLAGRWGWWRSKYRWSYPNLQCFLVYAPCSATGILGNRYRWISEWRWLLHLFELDVRTCWSSWLILPEGRFGIKRIMIVLKFLSASVLLLSLLTNARSYTDGEVENSWLDPSSTANRLWLLDSSRECPR